MTIFAIVVVVAVGDVVMTDGDDEKCNNIRSVCTSIHP